MKVFWATSFEPLFLIIDPFPVGFPHNVTEVKLSEGTTAGINAARLEEAIEWRAPEHFW